MRTLLLLLFFGLGTALLQAQSRPDKQDYYQISYDTSLGFTEVLKTHTTPSQWRYQVCYRYLPARYATLTPQDMVSIRQGLSGGGLSDMRPPASDCKGAPIPFLTESGSLYGADPDMGEILGMDFDPMDLDRLLWYGLHANFLHAKNLGKEQPLLQRRYMQVQDKLRRTLPRHFNSKYANHPYYGRLHFSLSADREHLLVEGPADLRIDAFVEIHSNALARAHRGDPSDYQEGCEVLQLAGIRGVYYNKGQQGERYIAIPAVVYLDRWYQQLGTTDYRLPQGPMLLFGIGAQQQDAGEKRGASDLPLWLGTLLWSMGESNWDGLPGL